MTLRLLAGFLYGYPSLDAPQCYEHSMDNVMDRSSWAKRMEHTLLAPTCGVSSLDAFCQEAVQLGVEKVCVAQRLLKPTLSALSGTGIRCVSVVGFPFGAEAMGTKVAEASYLVEQGAAEVDMVVPLGAVRDEAWDVVQDEIRAVVEAAGGPQGAPVKVIFETGHWTQATIQTLTGITRDSGAKYAKTCTGFGPRGVSVEDVQAMRAADSTLKIKASGGIKTGTQARALFDAGASVLGLSKTGVVLEELVELARR